MDEPFALAGFGGSVTGGGATPQHTFRVTNTNDSGEGSFRVAVANATTTGGTKLISIEVEGVTVLQSRVDITASNLTITGKNAPGLGWALAGSKGADNYTTQLITVSGENALFEHLRLYRGTGQPSTGGKVVVISGGAVAAFRHCTLAYCYDNHISVLGNVTFSYCLFHAPLHNNHFKGGMGGALVAHGYGPLISASDTSTNHARLTLHMCVVAHCADRLPLRIGNGFSECIGCLGYGWGRNQPCVASMPTSGTTRANLQGCVWMAAGYTDQTWRPIGLNSSLDDGAVHVGGTCVWQKPDFSQVTGWALAGVGSAPAKGTDTPNDFSGVSGWTQPEIPHVATLGDHLLPLVGATLPVRAYVDQLVVDMIQAAWAKTGHSGGIVDSVFKNGDPNTNPHANHATAPLTNYADGAGWREALDGKAVESEGATAVVAIALGSDDIMENTGSGGLIDGDQLLFRNTRQVGLRFLVPSMPQGVNIISAHVQLTAGKVGKGANTTTWFCEVLDTGTFSGAGNVTGRTKTAASVAWPIAPWPTAGARGAAQKSPDLKTLVQEAVNHGSFAGGVVFLVTIGSGAPGDRNAAGFGHAQMAPAEVTIVWEKA